MRREMPAGPLGKQALLVRNLCLFMDTSMNDCEIAAVAEDELTFELLCSVGCNLQAVRAAKLTVAQLYALGAKAPSDLRRIKMDTFDLCEQDWARDMVSQYGQVSVLDAFLRNAGEVQILLGTQGACVLNITLDRALQACVNEPTVAQWVLKTHMGLPHTLASTSMQRLLDAKLTLLQLQEVNINLPMLISVLQPTTRELDLLMRPISSHAPKQAFDPQTFRMYGSN